MKNQLRDLLDKIYELEGLTHLAIKRDDVKSDFLHLIASKGKTVAELCQSIDLKGSSEEKFQDISIDNTSLEEYSIDEELLTEGMETIKDNEESFINANNNSNSRGKLVFTINERFRFKKELFKNSDADFNNTLAVLASMEDYDEAEEYFLSEEGFNLGNPVVREFMEIIKKYFR